MREVGRAPRALVEAFWSLVSKDGPVHPTLGSRCWPWKGARGGKGLPEQRYGQLGSRRAHRISYELVRGPIPDGLVLDHLCRNRGCVNPKHLEVVTHRVNILRGEGLAAQAARQTTCINGHPLSGSNLRVSKTRGGRSRRVCRTCAAERKANWKARHCR